jgi:putative ABC transport system ATP-binding protein
MPVVRAEKVSKHYQLGKQKVHALRDIDLIVENGEFVALAGPSGSGKTTLLNLIGCIDAPTSGSLYINEVHIGGQTSDQLADLRARTIGFIFQTFNLLPVLSAEENIEYPLLQFKELTKSECKKRVASHLQLVGLERFAHHRPNELSGGQRQRVAIARALVTRPTIVVADEPTANLDHKTGAGILQLMKQINRTTNTTFIFSTHDPAIMEMSDNLIRINDGEIINEGSAAPCRSPLIA